LLSLKIQKLAPHGDVGMTTRQGYQTMRTLLISLFFALLVISVCAHGQQSTTGESQGESGPHFDRARELYALGPTKAQEILTELDLELHDHPENVKAFLLKATTQIGIGQFDAALATLDQLSGITSKSGTIYPKAVYLRARCLFYKGEYESAKHALEPFQAFFQDDDESRSQYDSLMAAITARMQKPNDS
jgi:tetratricopeptide (TPR) repeat protein